MSFPYFLIYSGDMQKHLGYRRASHVTKGVYLDLMLMANEGSERGVLIFNDVPLTKTEIAGVIIGDQGVILSAIEELIRLGLVVVRKDEALILPDIVAQEKERQDSAKRKRNQRKRDLEGIPTEEEEESVLEVDEEPPESHVEVTLKSRKGHTASSLSLSQSNIQDANASCGEVSPGEEKPAKRKKRETKADAKAREPNPFYQYFVLKYEDFYGTPYNYKDLDFQELAKLKRLCEKTSWPLTDEKWRRGADNYFATPMRKHTMDQLCRDFSPYFKSAQNEYGRPVGDNKPKSVNGHNGANLANSSPDQLALDAERFLAARSTPDYVEGEVVND